MTTNIHPNNQKVVDELVATQDVHKIRAQISQWRGQAHESDACKQRVTYFDTLGLNEDITKGIEEEDKPFDVTVAERYALLYSNAQRRGKEFDLTFTDVKRLMSKKTCAYTGERFSNQEGMNLTFERVDGTKGYVKGNVIAVTFKANQLKNALFENERSNVLTTPKQLRKMLAVIEKHTG